MSPLMWISRFLAALLLLVLVDTHVARATTFTMAVPNTTLTLPTTYPQAGGVAIVLEGANGNVYYQFINPSTMFQGFQNTGTPTAWQGNPFQIGPVMALNCGPVVSCSSYLGGGITRMSIRFTAYDGDNQAGQFDFNNLNLRINGSNFGASSGNWSVVATQNTDVTGATLISSNTGYGNNTFDTGWFQSTDTAILSNILSTGNITATVFDSDPNDNFWDFKRGNDATTAVVPLNVAPGVTINKASTTTSFATVGQVIPYTFTIRNIGSVWINPINVSDPKVTGVSCPAPPPATTVNLDPAEQIVCTANYTVTQSDVDAGVINNTATATGTPQAGALGPVTDTNSIPGPASAPSVDLTKTASPSPVFGAVGSTVTYAFAVRNTGNVTVTSVAVSDPLLPTLSCTVPSIAPGVTATAACTGHVLTVTQARVDAGTIANTASVSARAPNGTTVNDTANLTLNGPPQVRSFSIDKQSPTANFNAVGNVISYTYLLRNTGNVTLTGAVSVADNRTTTSCPGLPVAGLAPNATVSCSASYTITQADLDAGSVVNIANGTIGTTSTTVSDTVTVPAVQTRTLTLDKQTTTANYDSVGDVLSYSYILRNTGNVTLTGALSVTDNKTTVSCPALPPAGLAPNATHACTASYAATQADINAGSVLNIASASIGATAAANDQVSVPAIQTPGMTVAKTATSVNFTNVGDTVSYQYVATNIGNTTLTSAITISDNRVSPVNCPALPPGGLNPGATHTCTATYTIVLEDLDIGSVTNLASATSGPITSPQTSATIPAGSNPALTIDKTSTSTSFNAVGDVIPYTFNVTNTGNATFTRTLVVTDNKIGTFNCWVPPTTGPPAGRIFTPSETLTCNANYTVTQADLDAGFVTNQASASTTYGAANIPVAAPPDSLTVNAIQDPQLTVTKSATTLPVASVGQVLTYTIAVANTGDVTVSNINVTDPLIPALSCTIASLAPAASNSSCSGTYTVTQADFDAGAVNNTAMAAGSTPQGNPVSDTGALNVPITQNSSLAIAKSFGSNADEDVSGTISLGDTLSYAVTVSNDGNITQDNVVVTDALLTPNSATCASVAPGATCVLNGTLIVTQAQVDAGSVANTGSVTSTLLPTAETDAETVSVPRTSSLGIDKLQTANADEDSNAAISLNDTLTYTVTATNTGNVTQYNVVAADAQLSPSSQNCASLAPGATCVLTGMRTVTQADVNSGVISNTGSVTSTAITTPVTDAVSTSVPQTSSLSIGKALTGNADQDTSSSITVNDTLTYTVTVTNSGNVTQSNVVVADALLTPASATCAIVLPGAACVLSGTLTVSQSHVNAGTIDNSASVTSTLLPTPSSTALSTPITQFRALTVDKTSATPDYDAVGDQVSYSYLIRNTGNVTLSGAVSVTDNKTSVTCPALPLAGLAPNATHNCTATYTVRQADLDAGSVVNTAVAAVGATTSASDQVTVNADQNPLLSLDKTSPTASFNAVGDSLTYSYLLRNTGNVTLTGAVSVTDNKTTVSCPALAPAGLAPNATVMCSASYVVNQADIDAGSVINAAAATVGATSSPADQVTVPAIQTPSMSVDKTATSINFTAVGDRIDYEYVVFNTGNTTLTDPITVTDNRITPVTCDPLPPGGLPPGDEIVCTSTYVVLLQDLEIGSITNLASASSGTTTSPQAFETVPTGANPALSVKKSTGTTSFSAVGEDINYEFELTNTGNATFTRVINIVDDKIGTNICYDPSAGSPTFRPGEIITCAFIYVTTQADLDAGFVTNQAHAATTYSNLDIPVTSAPESVTVPADQGPGLAVSKSAATLPVASLGQVLTYTITVENAGNVTLSNITVIDPLIPTLNCSIASLAPSANDNSCSGPYTVTQVDYDAGGIANTATAKGVTPQGDPVENDGSINVPISQVVSLDIIKTYQGNSDEDSSGDVSFGDTLNYRIVVTNDGNVTQANVVVSDPLLNPASVACATVLPGQTCTLNGSLNVSQAQVDSGAVANTASVTSILLPTPETSAVSEPVPQTSSISVVKLLSSNADEDSSSSVTRDDTLTYSVVMTNTGNVTQTGVNVSDALLTPNSAACAAVSPGDTCILTGNYVVAQSNVDAGTIGNTGSVTTALIATPVVDTLDTPVAQRSSLSIAKSLSSNADGDASATVSVNDVLTYTVTVSNDGTITQNNVVVSDPLLTPSSQTCVAVAPGATCVLTGTLTVAQNDVNFGSVTNTANVISTEVPVAETADVTTSIPQITSVSVEKTTTTADYDSIGDTLSYSYLVRNTGNVTLTGSVTVADDRVTVVCPPLTGGELAPNGTVTCTATHSVTQADLDAGSVVNTASATVGGTTSPDDKVTINADQRRLLAVDKTSGTVSFDAVGDVVSYAYVLTNTGNVTLTGAVSVSDDKTLVTCDPMPVSGLEPTETLNCVATYTIVQADIDAGSVLNTASATIGTTTSPTDQVSVPAVQSPSMSIDKNATVVAFTNVGDTVSYEYVVTNTGNTTLTAAVLVSDNRVNPVTCPALPPGGLAPAATLTCTADYAVKLEDLALGSITNLASSTSGTTTSPPVSETVPTGATQALTIAKSSVATSFATLGERLPYSFLVTNSGNATFTNPVNVSDNRIGNIPCFSPTGADPTFTPGETVTCTGDYYVTQADLDAGSVTNTAFAITAFGAANIPVTSAPDDLTLNAVQTPQLTVAKAAATLPITAVNKVLTYTITVENMGNVTVSNINVTDPLIPALNCSIATLAPAASNATCQGTYTVSQADFDAGTINNTATASGITPQGTGVSDSGILNTPITQTSALSLAKALVNNADNDSSSSITMNDVLQYTVTATNTGNVTQTNVVVADPQISPSSRTCATLAPNATCVLTGTKIVAQAEVNAGTIGNTGSVTSSAISTPVTDTLNTPVSRVASLAIAKLMSGNADEDASATVSLNDTLSYTLTATNDGTVTQGNVVVSDALLTPASRTCATLAPGAACVLTGTYVVTQANVDAGAVNNTGSVTSTLLPTPETDFVSTPINQAGGLSLVKTALTSNFDAVGDVLGYDYLVSNTGNVTLTGTLSIADDKTSVNCPALPPGGLAPNATLNCSATYSVTLADLDAGAVLNTATATLGIANSNADQASVPAIQNPALVVEKSSAASTFDSVGDTLAYSYVVRNTGNVTLTGAVNVADDRTTVVCPPLPGGSLAPNATLACAATYNVTQADLDAGSVINTASATVGGTTSPDDQVTVSANQNPSLVVEKTSSTPSFDAVGDVVTYAYILRNTGNVTLTGAVSVADDKTAVTCDPLPVAGLGPTETLNCAATYTIVQADIDAGSVVNTATATLGTTTSPTDRATVPSIQNRAMTVDKNATAVAFTNIGDTVSYAYIVTNTGNTTLTDAITVTDNRVSPVTCPVTLPGGLAPSATLTCTADYAVKLEDLALGSITNLASSTSGTTTSPPISETVPAGANSALTVAKSSSSASFSTVGDLVAYSFQLTNSGNATFTRLINITDDKIGTIACFSPTAGDTTFAPGETVNCAANYAVTQADLDRGFVTNTAFASTTYGAANIPVTSPPDDFTVNADQTPELTVSKSAATLPITSANQVLTYTITVANTGNVSMSNINVTDPLIPALNCAIATLAPTAGNATCQGTYVVSQADFDAGSINNTATASSITPQGNPVSDTGNLTTSITAANPAVEIDKTADVSAFTTVGQAVSYRFTVRNTGDVKLSNIIVTDALVPSFSCTIATLVPGASNVSCATSYTVLQSDVDAGSIVNTATVSATPSRGTPPTDTDSVTVDGPARVTAMTVDKVSLDTVFAAVNDVIDYSFTVTNTGNVSINGPLAINDPQLTNVTCAALPISGLVPGGTVVCNGSSAVTQADLDSGSVTNTATASAVTPLGALTSPQDQTTVNAVQSPSITAVKTAGVPTVNLGSNASATDVGDQIVYTFAVANTGNVTLNTISVADAKVANVTCPSGALPSGGTVNCTGIYTLNLADLDAGAVTNTAIVSATPPSGPAVTDVTGTSGNNDTPTTTALTQTPSLTLVKSSASPTTSGGADANITDVGDVISYSFTVQNTGSVTLTNVSVTDAKVVPVTCAVTTVAPGASVICAGSCALVQADLDAGSVSNTALGSGNPPTGPPVTDTSGTDGGNDSETVTTIPQSPAIALVKTAGAITDLDGNGPDAGDTIAYTFTVSNPGSVTLRNVAIADPLVMAQAEPIATPLSQLADLGRVDLTTTASLPAAITPVSETPVVHADVPALAAALDVKRRLLRLDGAVTPLQVGDQIGVLFEVTNTGDGPFTNVGIAQNAAYSLGGPVALLAPNQSDGTTFISVYQLTADDIGSGKINLPARATAMNRNSEVALEINAASALSTVEVYNDVLTASITPASILTLAPGASATFDGLYALTQTDIDAGQVTNTATAGGTTPDGVAVSDVSDADSAAAGESDPTITTIVQSPRIDVVKTAGTPTLNLGSNAAITDAGDTIAYSFAVTNTGTVTLNSITVADAKVGAVTCAATTLAPAATTNCAASYTILQGDIDAGQVTNTATVSGTPPTGPAATDVSGTASGNDDPTVTPLTVSPSIEVVKTAAAPTIYLGNNTVLTDVGDEIAYNFVVTNTGNVTLTTVAVDDPKIGTVTCPVTSLAPQVSTTCTGRFVLQQLDLDLGSVTNTAVASGQPPTGARVQDFSGTLGDNDDPTVSGLVQSPAIGLTKSAGAITDVDGNGPDTGDTIAYAFTVTNLGNTTLLNISVTDPLVAVTGGAIASLLPGASDTTTFSAIYTLTQVDVNTGSFTNTADVSGTPPVTPTNPSPTPVTDTSDDDSTAPGADEPTVVAIPQTPAIGLVKLAGDIVDLDDNGPDAGDTIAYTFQISNLGNVTLTNIRLTDVKVAVSGGPLASLEPGITDNTTFTALYELTQADVDAGQVSNTAIATGTPPSGTDVSDNSDDATAGSGAGQDDPTVKSITQNPAVRLIKRASEPTVALGDSADFTDADDTISYSFTVLNTGNVTLKDISVRDALPGIVLSTGTISDLAPGSSDSTTVTAIYTIKTADIVNQGVENSAIATGNYVDINNAPRTVQDISGVPEDGVTRADPFDLQSGRENDTPTFVGLKPIPAITLLKTAEFNDTAPVGGNLGDSITYRFVVTNTGNVPLSTVVIADEKLASVTCDDTSLNVGQSTNCVGATYALTQDDINTGEVSNQAVVTADAAAGGTATDLSGTAAGNDTPTLTTFPALVAKLAKSASVATAAIGNTVIFTISATDVAFDPATIIDKLPGGLTYVPGSATINTVSDEPAINGRTLTFGNLHHVGNVITITLRAVVNTSAQNGTLINKAQLLDNDGNVVAQAHAKIEIRPEPVFDCGDIIGKVFDDANGNGTQDAATSPYEPERGLPGVRVATVNGELITTDKHGRFHIACADIPDARIGSNFILKVDPRSLPSGYRLTTENPKVVRLTRGKMSKINFGASISRVVRFNLSDKAFGEGELGLPQKLRAAVAKLVNVMEEEPSVLRLQYQIGESGKAIAQRRLEEAESYIRDEWGRVHGRNTLSIETRLLKLQQEGRN